MRTGAFLHRTPKLALLALTICLVSVFGPYLADGIAQPSRDANPPKTPTTSAPPGSAAIIPHTELERTQPSDSGIPLVGTAVWDDGTPAAGVRVRWGNDHVVSDEAGRVPVPATQMPEFGSAVSVLAPCWIQEGQVLLRGPEDGAHGEAFRLALPTRFCVRFSMDIDSEVLDGLRAQGRDALHVIANPAQAKLTDGPVGRLHLPLASPILRGDLEIHSNQTLISIRAQCTGGPRQGYDYFGAPVAVQITRRDVPQVHVSVTRSCMLRVRVVDHIGNPLPGCSVTLTGIQDGLTADLDWGRTSHLGDYVYLGAPGRSVSVRASHQGVTRTVEASVGSVEVICIDLDLSRLVRVRVTRSGRNCDAFEIGLRPWLFGRPATRPLSSWTDGVAWLEQGAVQQPLFVCWMDNGSLREQRVTLPTAIASQSTLDLDSLPPAECSRVDVKGWDGSRRLSISIAILSPSDALPAGERQRSIFAKQGMHFPAVPWGRYTLRIEDIVMRKPLLSTEIEVGPGPCEIVLTDYPELR